jgi:hypothetical protein
MGQIDDAQPRVPQPDATIHDHAATIRAAMPNLFRHSPHAIGIGGIAIKSNYAGNATHVACLSCEIHQNTTTPFNRGANGPRADRDAHPVRPWGETVRVVAHLPFDDRAIGNYGLKAFFMRGIPKTFRPA